jgi:transposase
VHIDYHVEVEGHYYSVPYALVKQAVEVRLTLSTVEVFHRGRRVASHGRSSLKGRHTTVTDHMPKAHQRYAEGTPQRLVRWAAQTGPATAAWVEAILTTRRHPHASLPHASLPQQGFRACLGILRLGKGYGAERLEAACLLR